jgi:purine nucleosidase
MLRKPVDAAYVFGADGMSNANFAKARQRPEARHAVDAIIDLVMGNPGEITILAQAPLTNIALAFLKEPRIAKAAKHLWIMGGTDNAIGNVTPAAEFNFYVDPEAAKIVLNAGFNVTLSTWTLTLRSGILPGADLEAIARLGTPLSQFFCKVNEATVAYSKGRHGASGSTHPDSLTCACMIDESLILESADCVVDVETAGELTRAYCSVSSPILPASEAADPDLPPPRRPKCAGDQAGGYGAVCRDAHRGAELTSVPAESRVQCRGRVRTNALTVRGWMLRWVRRPAHPRASVVRTLFGIEDARGKGNDCRAL